MGVGLSSFSVSSDLMFLTGDLGLSIDFVVIWHYSIFKVVHIAFIRFFFIFVYFIVLKLEATYDRA